MHDLKYLHLSAVSSIFSVILVGLLASPQMPLKLETALKSSNVRQTFRLPTQNSKAQTLETQTVEVLGTQTVEADSGSSRRLNFVKLALVGISASLVVLLIIFLWHTSPRRRMRTADLKKKADDTSDEEAELLNPDQHRTLSRRPEGQKNCSSDKLLNPITDSSSDT
ncbi:MAG: hypothetical protein OXI96_02515 [Acidimicrobiaceae bacterium]|nr:hypothetical protein [Acidimicrobiaceae bacterium]